MGVGDGDEGGMFLILMAGYDLEKKMVTKNNRIFTSLYSIKIFKISNIKMYLKAKCLFLQLQCQTLLENL